MHHKGSSDSPVSKQQLWKHTLKLVFKNILSLIMFFL